MSIRFADRENRVERKGSYVCADLCIGLGVAVFLATMAYFQLTGSELFGIWW